MYMNRKHYCSTCNIGFDSITHYERHCETQKHKNMSQSPKNNTTLQYMNEHENLKQENVELKHKIDILKSKIEVMESWIDKFTSRLVINETRQIPNEPIEGEDINLILESISSNFSNEQEFEMLIKDYELESIIMLDYKTFELNPMYRLFCECVINNDQISDIITNFICDYIDEKSIRVRKRRENKFCFIENNEWISSDKSHEYIDNLIPKIREQMKMCKELWKSAFEHANEELQESVQNKSIINGIVTQIDNDEIITKISHKYPETLKSS